MNAPAGILALTGAVPVRGISSWFTAGSLLSLETRSRLRSPLKFFTRALAHPRLTQAWLARLAQADLAPLWAKHPRLATKLQRPYVSSAWSPLERLGALLGHYDFLPRYFSPAARAAIYRDGLTLVRLITPVTGRVIDLKLAYVDQFEKEGELTLQLHDFATGLNLAGLTFCVADNAGRRVIIIGGLQASPDPRMRDLIHDVAKECHGLRPKALALWCLQELAAEWQVAQIQAVGDDQHIYRHNHKRRDFAASYDEFWSESDGSRIGPGSWELPGKLRPRTREELKPQRRKAHERRYAMLAALRPCLLDIAATFGPSGGHSATLHAQPVEVALVGRAPVVEAPAPLQKVA